MLSLYENLLKEPSTDIYLTVLLVYSCTMPYLNDPVNAMVAADN